MQCHNGAQYIDILPIRFQLKFDKNKFQLGSYKELVWAPFPDISTAYYSTFACLLCLLCVCVSADIKISK